MVDPAIGSLRGCVVINGALSATASSHPGAQQLTTFLAELPDMHAASTIAASTGPGPRGGFAGLGVAVGPVCAVMVSRSVAVGIESYERDGSLERFRDGLTAILAGHLLQ
jgi:hypothetical protein